MIIENILQQLEKVRSTGQNKWTARCPAHNDKGPSLAIREVDDGRVLLHCFAGCHINEVLDSLGMTFNDLYPEKPLDGHASKPLQKPWTSRDALIGLMFESLVLLHFAKQLQLTNGLTSTEQARLLLCVSRIQRAQEVVR